MLRHGAFTARLGHVHWLAIRLFFGNRLKGEASIFTFYSASSERDNNPHQGLSARGESLCLTVSWENASLEVHYVSFRAYLPFRIMKREAGGLGIY